MLDEDWTLFRLSRNTIMKPGHPDKRRTLRETVGLEHCQQQGDLKKFHKLPGPVKVDCLVKFEMSIHQLSDHSVCGYHL